MDVLWLAALVGVSAGVDVWLLRTGRRGGVALLFALVAVLATWPLAASLAELPANAPAPEDARLFLWDLWWVRTALEAGQSPLRTDMLFAPHGTTLVFHGLALPQALATLPLQSLRPGLAGLVLAYDAVVLGSFALAGWAAYRLALRVVGHPAGAIVCGLAFTLQTLHFASTVRFHALAIEWLPLTLLALLRVLEHGRARDGVWLGLAWAGAFLASIEYAYFLLLAGAVLAGFQLLRRGERARELAYWWRGGLAAAAAAALVTLPYWLAFADEVRLTHASLGEHARNLTPDVFDLLLPDPRHSLLAGPIAALRAGLGLAEGPTAVALGWTLLALASAGAVRAWRRRADEILVWALLALVFILLMLGPSLRILGSETGIPGPYALLAWVLPFFEQARMPMRFGPLAQLALGILAAYAVAGLAGRLGPERGLRVALAAGALVAFEGLRVPLATAPVEVPEAYFRVAEQSAPGESRLLEWPPGLGASAEIEGLHQIVHGQRLVQDLPLFLPRVARENQRTAHGPAMHAFVGTMLDTTRISHAKGEARERLLAKGRRNRETLKLGHVVLRRRDLDGEAYGRLRDQLLLLEPSTTFEDEDAFLASFVP